MHRPTGHWDSSLVVNDRVALTTSRDILEAIADKTGPTDKIIALAESQAATLLNVKTPKRVWPIFSPKRQIREKGSTTSISMTIGRWRTGSP